MTTTSPPVEQAHITEILPPAGDGPSAQVPMPLTKLGKAMEAVKSKLTVIDQFGKDIRDLIANNPKDRKYDLSTKAGEKECDEVRKLARAKRLAIKGAWDEGKKVLRTLGDDLKGAAEGDIATLQAIEENAKSQIDAKATAETERKARHEKGIAAITALAEGLEAASSETVTQRMAALEAVVVDDSYQEFQPQAERKLREARDTLTAAFAAAMQREQQAEEARKRQAQADGAKAKIKAIKDLPDQVAGTDSANIREALRIHEATLPHGEQFGELLEFAEMAHELATTKLRALLDAALAEEVAQAPTADLFAESSVESPGLLQNLPHDETPHFQHADDDGPEVLEPTASGQDAEDDPFSAPIKPAEALKTALNAIEAQFGKPDPATTTAPAPRAIPAARGSRQPAPAPSPAPAPVPAPSAGLDPDAEPEGEEHDLLSDAKQVLAIYDNLKVLPGSAAPLSMVMKGPFGAAMERLRATIVFINEFAD